MANFYYTDAGGTRRGPLNEHQLQSLATKGIIKPKTILETEDGRTGAAGQVKGLKFETVVSLERRMTNDSKGSAPWLVDFAFTQIRLPDFIFSACAVTYALYFLAAILCGLWMTFTSINNIDDIGIHVTWLIPLQWIGVLLSIIIVRLLCEWTIMLVDWVVQTTEAARNYRE